MTSAELADQLIKEQLAKMQQQQAERLAEIERQRAESKRVMDRQTKRDVAAAFGKTIPFTQADFINYG